MLGILLIFSIPIYGFGIWALYEPEESFFFLDRWRFKEISELSDIQIKLIRIGNVVGMILWTILLIYVAIDTFTPKPPFPTIDLKNNF
ncbi:hypothetical protein [Ornithinibacillus halophilus]|uniref:DUF6199 domain-containing protein n=1 Tax=Ornithinibacillus halophilus TaxID=930117 RepID=A0A1M5L879_9BACI|nr:hypothetical protein [Ornithinibacillus halophilus]SHG61221.1 hypothetical protein SAMN05216225_10458 [Ornithinibacillus halophilus]